MPWPLSLCKTLNWLGSCPVFQLWYKGKFLAFALCKGAAVSLGSGIVSGIMCFIVSGILCFIVARGNQKISHFHARPWKKLKDVIINVCKVCRKSPTPIQNTENFFHPVKLWHILWDCCLITMCWCFRKVYECFLACCCSYFCLLISKERSNKLINELTF